MCFSVIEYPFWSWKVAFSIVAKLGIFHAPIFNHFDNSSYKGLSTVLQKGIFMNPTRGFAVVLTREFLFVTTWVISFFASLRHSIFWTGKLLNANRTLFEEYGNSYLIILHPTVFLLTCSVRRITLVFKLFPSYPMQQRTLCSTSFKAQAGSNAFSRRLFRNTDRKLLQIISDFNIRQNKTYLPKEISSDVIWCTMMSKVVKPV